MELVKERRGWSNPNNDSFGRDDRDAVPSQSAHEGPGDYSVGGTRGAVMLPSEKRFLRNEPPDGQTWGVHVCVCMCVCACVCACVCVCVCACVRDGCREQQPSPESGEGPRVGPGRLPWGSQGGGETVPCTLSWGRRWPSLGQSSPEATSEPHRSLKGQWPRH